MDATESDGPVLVAVGHPDHVQQLVRTAGDLARLGSGTVRLVTVAVKPYDSPFGIFEDDTIRHEFSTASHELLSLAEAPAGVTVEREVVVGRTVGGALVSTIAETDPAALVVGWQGRANRADAVFGTTVDRLIERAPCDLYVERIGREANGVESVLLPVAGGPHVAVAARAATAIATHNEARVVVFSVAEAETGTDDAEAFAAAGVEAVTATDATVPVTANVDEAANVTTAIVDESVAHDVVVLGATRQGPLRRRLVGSVARRLVGRTETTVILARDGNVVGGPLHRLGGLLRR